MFIIKQGKVEKGYLTLGDTLEALFKDRYNGTIDNVILAIQYIELDYMRNTYRPTETGYYIITKECVRFGKNKEDYQVRIDELGLVLPLLEEPIPYEYLGVVGKIHYQDDNVTVIEVTDVSDVIL